MNMQLSELLELLRTRFEANMQRHPGLTWQRVQTALAEQPKKMQSLLEMERTGGEPDVVELQKNSGEYLFIDCSSESPAERRSLCYDRAALEARKSFKPKDTALDVAAKMGVTVLTEQQYRQLQTLGDFDTKTSSWLLTPEPIRKLGGALFADRRYDTVFVFHNGADSYYASRGFRGCLSL